PRVPAGVQGGAGRRGAGPHPSADPRHPIQREVRDPPGGLAEGNQAAGHHRGSDVKIVDKTGLKWEDVGGAAAPTPYKTYANSNHKLYAATDRGSRRPRMTARRDRGQRNATENAPGPPTHASPA